MVRTGNLVPFAAAVLAIASIIEAGVWRGGASILARAVLRATGDASRRVLVADSFEGLPAARSKL